MKKLFSLFFVLVASAGTMFASVKVGDLYYDLDATAKTATVTSSGSDKYSGSIVIPSSVTYNNVKYNVTSIGSSAFKNCSGLTSITIPNSVTSIGDDAFRNCSSLRSVTIPNSVTSIGDYAFHLCESLTSIEIPNSVTSIGNYVFSTCRGLTSVEIPNSVTSIGDGAFHYCENLISIRIPNSVTSIGKSAFNYCPSLISLAIPNSVTYIGNYAFYNCNGLTSVKIPESVTSIGKGVFCACGGLISIEVSTNNPNYCSIDGVVFNKYKTTLIQYPAGKQGAYSIPNSVTSIGDDAFYYCYRMTSITIPNSVTSIGDGAFHYCENLTSVRIPNSVTSIGSYAFSGCSSLTSIEIPNGITNINEYSFYGCAIENLVLSASVKAIDWYAFAYNYAKDESGYQDYTIPSIKTITCYSMRPPSVQWGNYDRSFPENQPYSTIIYVPADYMTYYQVHDFWGLFDVRPIGAATTETTTVATTTTENSVNVTWPAITGAYSYELVIKDKEGKVICTLTFNSNGQLTSIAFNAPSRDGAPQKTQTAGFSFTITGLDPGTEYGLTIIAKNESGQEIDRKDSSFHTNWPNGIEDIHVDSDKPVKVLMDGQIFILCGEHIFDTQGKRMK